jgi:hypothetical protein
VIAADTHAPLAGTSVFLSTNEGEGGLARSVVTGRDGRFEFQQLHGGRYWLSASRPGFPKTNYGQRHPKRPGQPIDVAEGQTVAGLTFSMVRGGVLSGTVTGADGEPVPNASVSVLRYAYVEGQRKLQSAGEGQPLTDDRGAYRVAGLDAGQYFVGVRVPRTAEAGQPSTEINPNRATIGPFGGDLTLYPGTPLVRTAMAIDLSPGEERAGLDIRLPAESVTTVSGTVKEPDGRRGRAMILIMLDGNETISLLRADAKADGSFLFPTVPSGEYVLVGDQFSNPFGTVDQMRFSVAGKPVSLQVQLQPTHTLSGHVMWRGSAPTATGARVLLTLHETRAGLGNDSRTRAMEPDGSFRFDGAVAGRYYITADGPAGWSLGAVKVGNQDVTDLPFDYDGSRDVDDLSIELTDSATELRGTLVDTALRPAIGYMVIAFPEEDRFVSPFSRRIQTSQTSAEGVFLLRALPPGDYRLAAVDDIDDGAWFAPAFLQTIRTAAQPVHLGEREQKTVALRIRR